MSIYRTNPKEPLDSIFWVLIQDSRCHPASVGIFIEYRPNGNSYGDEIAF